MTATDSHEYDAANTYPDTLEDAQAAVGCRATLALTGFIESAGESGAGAFVRFVPDARWGFGAASFVADLAAFQVEPRP